MPLGNLDLRDLEYIRANGGRVSVFWICETQARAKRIDKLQHGGYLVSRENLGYPWVQYDVMETPPSTCSGASHCGDMERDNMTKLIEAVRALATLVEQTVTTTPQASGTLKHIRELLDEAEQEEG